MLSANGAETNEKTGLKICTQIGADPNGGQIKFCYLRGHLQGQNCQISTFTVPD